MRPGLAASETVGPISVCHVHSRTCAWRTYRSPWPLRINFLGQQLPAFHSLRGCNSRQLYKATVTSRSSNTETRQSPPATTRRVSQHLLAILSVPLLCTISLLTHDDESHGMNPFCCAVQRAAVSPPREPVRQPPAVRERTLSRSQVVDKQVRCPCMTPHASSQNDLPPSWHAVTHPYGCMILSIRIYLCPFHL